jgi:hypothetical protein
MATRPLTIIGILITCLLALGCGGDEMPWTDASPPGDTAAVLDAGSVDGRPGVGVLKLTSVYADGDIDVMISAESDCAPAALLLEASLAQGTLTLEPAPAIEICDTGIYRVSGSGIDVELSLQMPDGPREYRLLFNGAVLVTTTIEMIPGTTAPAL